jgi:hypothetical protein
MAINEITKLEIVEKWSKYNVYINCVYFWVYPQRLVYIGFKPLKMDLTEGSETSANINQTLGIHPKADTVNTDHSESLK